MHEEPRSSTDPENPLLSNPRTIQAQQISLLDGLSDRVVSQDATTLANEIPTAPPAQAIAFDDSDPLPPAETSSEEMHSEDILLAETPPDGELESFLLPVGTIISSPGGHFTYRILGACCRLFDRNELPWPCCRIQWRSKEPSWRRIGKRFVPDLATKRFPSYMVEIIDHEYSREPFMLTLYWSRFPSSVQNWWYTKYVPPTVQSSPPTE